MMAQCRRELRRIDSWKRWKLLWSLGWWLRELWLRGRLKLLMWWYNRGGKLLLTRRYLVLLI